MPYSRYKTSHQHAPQWLRQRAIGNKIPKPQVSIDSMRRLQLETCLDGHLSCVNCLEWNSKGDLLASGSDDGNIIIWNPFKGVKKNLVRTQHEGNIFSVKFIPEFGDTLIATCASDGQVKLINTLAHQTVMNCKSCHSNRVKRLAVHPNQPHLLWSAGEDGFIMQYDIRQVHSCKQPKPKELLIDLKATGEPLSAKCIAVNPMRDEMLAVGANDVHVRLFDRRFIKSNSSNNNNSDSSPWNSCALFTPGHLHKPYRRVSPLAFGTTYLAFSPDGSELLANILAEQVYLFNVYEPWKRYKSFDSEVKPLVLDLPVSIEPPPQSPFKLKSCSHWQMLKKLYNEPIQLPARYQSFYDEVAQKLKIGTNLTKAEFDRINQLLAEIKNCPSLYHLRASAFLKRGWMGDHYQAIRDSCCALALNPMDYQSLINLAFAAYSLVDKETASGLVETIRLVKNGSKSYRTALNEADLMLKDFLRNSLSTFSKEMRFRPMEEDEDDEYYYSPSNQAQLHQSQNQEEQENPILGSNYHINTNDEEEEEFPAMQRTSYIPRGLNLPSYYSNEQKESTSSYDYTKRFCGHCNMNTDIKEVNFFGNNGEFVVGGSDDGAFYIWDKYTTNIVKAVQGDMQILNCLQPHPTICMLATSGIESTVKLWSPSGKIRKDVESLELRCTQNQDFVSDPLEAMLLMLYSNRDN